MHVAQNPLKLLGAVGLGGLVALVSPPAAAQDVKRECIDASTAGQTSRDAGALLKARAQFVACARDACPNVVRASCSQWLSDVEQQLPSVVIRAADSAGVDITDGSAKIDGSEVPLDGKPISLDPGPHLVTVEAPNGSHLEKKVLLAAGEKSRLIELRAAAALPPPTSAEPPTAPPTAPRDASSSASWGPWLLGGTSLVALGSFTFFAVSAKSELHRLETTCSPACRAADSDVGRRDAVLADVSLGVSVAALAGALTWALLDGAGTEPRTEHARLTIAPGRRGGFASLSASF